MGDGAGAQDSRGRMAEWHCLKYTYLLMLLLMLLLRLRPRMNLPIYRHRPACGSGWAASGPSRVCSSSVCAPLALRFAGKGTRPCTKLLVHPFCAIASLSLSLPPSLSVVPAFQPTRYATCRHLPSLTVESSQRLPLPLRPELLLQLLQLRNTPPLVAHLGPSLLP